MSFRRRRSPLDVFARGMRSAVHALGQLCWAACVPFLIVAELWTGLLHSSRRSVRRLSRVNWLRLILVYIRLPFIELLRATRWVFASMIGWWPRASFRHLAQGFPAIGAVLLTTLPLVIAGGKSLPQYDLAAVDAYRDRDFETAEVYFRALAEKEPDNEDFRYRLALAVDGLREHERALAMMQSLASPKQQGYPLAHFWLAQQKLLSDRSAEVSAEAEAHLKRAIQGSPNFADAHAELGVLYLASGRLKEAEPHLLKAAQSRPELWINVAQLRVLQGNREKARDDAEKAVDYYRTKAEANLDDVRSRLYWAECLGFLEQYDAAANVLLDGMKFSSDAEFPRGVSRVYFRWAELLRARRVGTTAANQHTLLVRSFQYNPMNPMLLRRLVLGVKDQGEDGTLVRSVLRTLLGRGQSLSVVDMLLAVDAQSRNQSSTAENYLQRGRGIDPKLPALLGELAMSFADAFPAPQPDQGFALINLGLRAWPHDPEMLFARGFLYYRGGLWLEALIDLEAAAPKKADNADIHRLLAAVYKHLGMQDKANAHLDRATAAR